MPVQTKAPRTEVRSSKKTRSSVAVTPKPRPELTDQTGEEEASLRVHEAIRDDILFYTEPVKNAGSFEVQYINVMRRMSVDCDCAGVSAAEPTIGDIGIVASTDILAVDQASIDMVYKRTDNHDLVERIESRHGLHQLAAMRDLKMGNEKYELISID